MENSILAPFGLTHETFIKKQRQLAPSLVETLTAKILHFDPFPQVVELILAGFDGTGPHIYVVRGFEITCHDSTGFAAIGSGAWHAESQFMFAGHARHNPLAETMLLLYAAKKRAEVSPGVGEDTDLFQIGPLPHGLMMQVPDYIVDELEKSYWAGMQGSQTSWGKAERKVWGVLRQGN